MTLIVKNVYKYMYYSSEFSKLLNAAPNYQLYELIESMDSFIQRSIEMHSKNEETRAQCSSDMEFHWLNINIPYYYMLLSYDECLTIANKYNLDDSLPIEKLWILAAQSIYASSETKNMLKNTVNILENLNDYDMAIEEIPPMHISNI